MRNKLLNLIIYFKKYKETYLWLVVFIVLVLNILLNSYLVLAPIFGDRFNSIYSYSTNWLFSPLNNVIFGHYVAKKLYIPFIALVFLFFWILDKNRGINFFKKHVYQILLILTVLSITRILSFTHWFYLDDYRFLRYYFWPNANLQVIPCCGDDFTVQGFIYLVMRWFGDKFYLYNLTGLVIYAFIGITIYVICLKLQRDKIIALLISLFFVTTPTYFYATLAMVDFMGDGFTLLLFTISLYFILSGSIVRALIFAFASLEFGLSRSYSIPLPFILTALFFIKGGKWKLLVSATALLILFTLSYIPLIKGRSGPNASPFTFYLDLKNWAISLNMLVNTVIPLEILKVIVKAVSFIYSGPFITPVLGLLVPVLLICSAVLSYIKKYYTITKFILIGSSIILASIILPPMMGVRADRHIMGFTKEVIDANHPVASTGYGHFPAFGLVFIWLAISLISTSQKIKKILVVIIIMNAVTFVYSDYIWHKGIAYKQRNINTALHLILPKDGKKKLILMSYNLKYLKANIIGFQDIYRANEELYLIDDPKNLEVFVKSNSNFNERQVYFLSYDTTLQKIIDLTEKYREGKYKKSWWLVD